MDSEDIVTFWRSTIPSTSFTAFENMRKKGKLCDITIKVGEHLLTAHRVILAAAIPYFDSAFAETEDKCQEKEMTMEDLDPKALESLINFAYTGKVIICLENAKSLLVASNYLDIDEVQAACAEFLLARLSTENVIQVYVIAVTVNNSTLIENCTNYMQKNYEDVSKVDDFLGLPYSRLKEMISRDDLSVSSEITVFESVLKWVKASPTERHEELPGLLSEVRMIFLPSHYLIEKVETEDLIKSSPKCKELINEIKNYLLSKKAFAFPNMKTRPRKLKNSAYAICCYPSDTCSVQYFIPVEQTWYNLASDVLDDEVFSIAAVNNKIYIFLETRMKVFHVSSLRMVDLKGKHENFSGYTISYRENMIYCFGSGNKGYKGKVRFFDTLQDNWVKEGKMKTTRDDSACASLEDFIYVTGGRGILKKVLNIVEKYNPLTDLWSDAAAMLTPRCSHGCSTLNGKIYVFGGLKEASNKNSYLQTAEVYEPIEDQWTSVSSMNVARWRFSVTSQDDKIFVFGGEAENNKPVLETETYDPENDKWSSGPRVPEGFKYAARMFYSSN